MCSLYVIPPPSCTFILKKFSEIGTLCHCVKTLSHSETPLMPLGHQKRLRKTRILKQDIRKKWNTGYFGLAKVVDATSVTGSLHHFMTPISQQTRSNNKCLEPQSNACAMLEMGDMPRLMLHAFIPLLVPLFFSCYSLCRTSPYSPSPRKKTLKWVQREGLIRETRGGGRRVSCHRKSSVISPEV